MSLTTEPFDPSESEDRRKSAHISKKEVIVILIVLVILILILWPLYVRFKLQRDKHICKDNLSQISKGLFLYAEENSGRLPPLYVAGDSFEPRQFDGRANTWITLIAPGVRKPEDSFSCPGSQESEHALSAGPSRSTIRSSVGMFGALSAAPTDYVPNPSTQVMVAETSNQGARGTFDPKPILDPQGHPVRNGFVIGFDNSNFLPDDSSMADLGKSKTATRLAFYGTSQGEFLEAGEARHPGGIHFLFADGHIETLKPPVARIQRGTKSGEIIRAWQVR